MSPPLAEKTTSSTKHTPLPAQPKEKEELVIPDKAHLAAQQSSTNPTRLVLLSLKALQPVANTIPVPGLASVVKLLIDMCTRLDQSTSNAREWQELAKRMASLTYLCLEDKQLNESLTERFREAITFLQCDLSRALAAHSVMMFFNATDDGDSIRSHNERLNRIVADWTLHILRTSNVNINTLEANIKSFHERLSVDVVEVIFEDFQQEIDVTAGNVGYVLKGNALYIPSGRNVSQIYREKIKVGTGNVGITIGD